MKDVRATLQQAAEAISLSPSSSRAVRGVLWLAIGTTVALIFHGFGSMVFGEVSSRSFFVWIAQQWSRSDPGAPDYSHAWLAVFFPLYLLWIRRDDLRGATKNPDVRGLTIVGVALGFHWLGLRSEHITFSALAFVMLLWGIPWTLLGPAVARICFFACAYLVLLIPVNALDAVSFPLRLLSTQLSAALLNGLALPVIRSGTSLTLALAHPIAIDVADPCSGLKSLMAGLAIAAAFGYVTERAAVKRWLLFLSAIPLAVVANTVRICVIMLVGTMTGPGRFFTFFHESSGYLVFVIMILMIMGLGRLMKRWPDPAPHAPRKHAAPPPWLPAWIPPALLLLILPATLAGFANMRPVPFSGDSPIPVALPDSAGPWIARGVWYCQDPSCGTMVFGDLTHPPSCPACRRLSGPLAPSEHYMLPSDVLLVRRVYQREAALPWVVTLLFSGASRSGIHKAQWCLMGQGARIQDSRPWGVDRAPRLPLIVMLLKALNPPRHAGNGAVPMLYAYWFVGKGMETPYHGVRMLKMLYERAVAGETYRWVYVSVQGPEGWDRDARLKDLSAFIRALDAKLHVPSQDP